MLAAEERAPDGQDRQLVRALGHEAPRGLLERAVTADVGRCRERLDEPQTGHRRSLGDRLGVVEVEAAAEGEPAGGEDEGRGAVLLGGQRGDAHGLPAVGRAVGPDQRQTQLAGTPLGRRALGRVAAGGARRVGHGERAGEDVGVRRAPGDAHEQAVDALGGKVGPRGREVEGEGHARARSAGAAAALGTVICKRYDDSHPRHQRNGASNLAVPPSDRPRADTVERLIPTVRRPESAVQTHSPKDRTFMET
jgi:hypothetical protein